METVVGLFGPHRDVLHSESLFLQSAWPPVAVQPTVTRVEEEGGVLSEEWLPVINRLIGILAQDWQLLTRLDLDIAKAYKDEVFTDEINPPPTNSKRSWEYQRCQDATPGRLL